MKALKQKGEAVNTKTIDRRQFLQSGLMAAALVSAGKLPLLSAETTVDSDIDATTGPYAVKPIRDYLSRFSHVETPLRRGQYSLTYDIIHWQWKAGKRNTIANTVVGQVFIKSERQNNQAMYDISQQTIIGGVNNFIEAQITCNADVLGSLSHWNLHSYEQSLQGKADRLSYLTEQGTCQDGRIQVDSSNYSYEFEAENPVVTQWTVLDMLIRKASPQLSVTFDLLQDLSLFKANQSLVYDGQTPVTIKDGNTVILQTYAQIGQGVLPIHYLLDAEGRPQLITSSILSWALSGLRRR